MKKFEKRDYIFWGFILLFIISYNIFLYCNGYMFGSAIDWANQHIVIPEYFREIFYNTGKIIPSFALNLGMGQNIYNFSYYGLLSPIILVSYLLPHIPMYIYMPLASTLSLLSSMYLFYTWIKKKYNYPTAVITTTIFLLNAPFIYHFHRHLMFVIYMPFMIGALKSVDLYLKENRPVSLIVYLFLLIMTNYYFGAYGVIFTGIYTIYCLLSKKRFNYKKLGNVIFYELIAVLLSGILLIPTIYALLNGRTPTNITNNYTIFNLFSPLTNYNYTFYSSYYSWGITFIYILAIIEGFLSKKKNQIFLSSIMSLIVLFPMCSYILNGFMYFDGKCFIPFIPIALLQVSEFINKVTKNKTNLQFKHLVPIILIIILCSLNSDSKYILIADIILSIIYLSLRTKIKNKYLLFIPTIIISIVSFGFSATNETYMKINTLKEINNPAYYELANIKDSNNLYRVNNLDNKIYNPNKIYNSNNLITSEYSSLSNKNYLNFYREIFQNDIINRDNTTITATNNLLFNIYSASKYIISNNEENVPLGYQKVKTIDNISLYQNKDVLPLMYVTDNVMSRREFELLNYPQTIDALLNYIIVDKALENIYQTNLKKYSLKNPIINLENLKYEKKNDHYIINSDKNASINIKLNNDIKNEALLIKFNMNSEKDGFACSSNITINGITNALSCSKWKYHNQNYSFEYVLSSNQNINELNITLTPGYYDISDIELYTISYESLKKLNKKVDPIIIDQIRSTNDHIYGTVTTNKDGYVKTTIPYDYNGFKIYLDGEEVDKVWVDKGFIGFEISKGVHDIEITYTSPYLKLGIISSLIGIILLGFVIIYNKIKKQYLKVVKAIKKFLIKIFKIIKKFLINNKGYVLLFISLFILDLSLRIFYNRTVNYYHWYNFVPNLFSIIWITTILLITKALKNKTGKTIFILFYIFSFIMFLVHAIYFSYFNQFFDYSVLAIAGEGTEYFDSVLLNIKIWVYIVSIISIFLLIKGIKIIDHDTKIKYTKILIIIASFIILELFAPILLGTKNKEIEWDDWRNARLIYQSFNDNNKSMMVCGMFEYNVRDFYINYFKNNTELTLTEKEALEENFKDITLAEPNKYTGILKGKNLILVQLESIDSFLVNDKIMPYLTSLSKKSINFTKHYSYTSGGGSTFNSEFMVNTGYSSAYNYNQSAYSFSRNTYLYSLPNLFKKEGYISNAFHMNTSEYYSRGVNYKAFGYEAYYGLQDQKIYNNYEYWLDTELIKNDLFNQKMFNTEQPFIDYIITYSAHMPYKTNKGTCALLTDKVGLTEEECLHIQAKETDDFIKLLFNNLKEKNLIDNTVVILFSDHYIYTLENKTILEKYKETNNNLINLTPFMIYNNGKTTATIKVVNSQLDILPTILNLFGIEYYPNNYLGRDILDPNYDPLVFFPDGSWYNGSTYVANGETISGKKISSVKIERNNRIVKKKMLLNDAVIKSDYFANQKVKD